MKTRPALALLLGLALPLAVGVAIEWVWSSGAQHDSNDNQMVSLRRRLQMPEYKRSCRKAADCPAPLSCVVDFRVDGSWCLASECVSDLQCDPGFVCQWVPSMDGRIRACVPPGIQKEGEECLRFPLKPADSCIPGLRCNWAFCGRPCRLDEPASCPRGKVCRDDINGPSCVPSCLETGCPSGKDCITVEDKFSICLELHGENCQKNLCAEGESCQWNSGHTAAAMWCAQNCDPRHPCQEGFFCNEGHCKRACHQDVPGECTPDEECQPSPVGTPWLCWLKTD